nr:MAG TPA: hypothetical protein [Caudoviricetes sp.]
MIILTESNMKTEEGNFISIINDLYEIIRIQSIRRDLENNEYAWINSVICKIRNSLSDILLVL